MPRRLTTRGFFSVTHRMFGEKQSPRLAAWGPLKSLPIHHFFRSSPTHPANSTPGDQDHRSLSFPVFYLDRSIPEPVRGL